MFCAKCGTQNSDGSAFCLKCGAPLTGGDAAPAYQVAAQQQAWGRAGVNSTPMPAEGNIGAAWRDITSSPGWLKRVLVLCLIGCVPILNFAVEGYGIRWARDLSFGKRESLPSTVFKRKEISTGFFAWLVRIGLWCAFCMLAGVAVLLLGGIFGMFNAVAAGVVTTILFVVVIVFGVFFFNPAVDASVMRMSIVGYLESGFNFGVAWQAFRQNMGSLIGASFLPRFIVGIVQTVVVSLLSFLAGFVAGMSVYSAAANYGVLGSLGSYSGSSSYAYGSPAGISFVNDLIGSLLGIGAGVLFLMAIIWIISAMFNVFSTLFAYRAVGHWVARNVPAWASEGDGEVDAANAGGVAFDGIGAGASVQPPASFAGAATATQLGARQAPPQDLGDTGTTRLANDGRGLSLMRRSNNRAYDVTAFPATVGKGSAATVRIEDNNSISRTHVRISFTGSSYVVEELGATNKTYLNGDELAEGEIVVLRNGDILSLAGEEFTVRIG